MARVVHLAVRARYRLLVLALAAAVFVYISPLGRGAAGSNTQARSRRFSISPAAVMEWSAGLGQRRLPPLRGADTDSDSDVDGAWEDIDPDAITPPPPPEDPKVAKEKANRMKKHKDKLKSEFWSGKGASSKHDQAAAPVQPQQQQQVPTESLENDFFTWNTDKPASSHPRPKPARKPAYPAGPPVPDPFPLLSAHPAADVLRAPAVNRGGADEEHYPEATPLLIGFTRNWPQLLQCVVSYVAAGWPPGDIYVVENTGAMRANTEGRLTLQNPFYLNHTQLGMLGVNVLVTPTLLTFAQLQNYFAWTALERNWTEYFWSHQDLIVFSLENEAANASDSSQTYYTLYERCVGVLQYLRQAGIPKWAHHFFAYDHLTLVNRDAILAVGGWDTHIPYYAGDCDMYVRLMWAGYWQGETTVGLILDVATVLDDVGALLRVPGIHAAFAGDPGPEPEQADDAVQQQRLVTVVHEDDDEARRRLVERRGETWEHLVAVGYRMEEAKYADGGGWRNTWQLRQTGGQGEPFARDAEGFETGLHMMIDTGRSVFAEKWGHRGCDIARIGIRADDAWQLERDWDPETEGMGHQGGDW